MEKDIKYALSVGCQKGWTCHGPADGVTCIDVNAGIALMIAVSEALEDAVNLLGLLWKLDLHEQFAYGHVDWITKESKLAHVASQNGEQKGVIGLAEVAGNHALVEIVCLDSFEVSAWSLTLFALWQNQCFSANVH